MTASTLDTITVLHAPGMCLAKRLSKDGTIHGYDRARVFGVSALPVNNLDGIGETFSRLLPLGDRCIVRGALIDGETGVGVRRLLRLDPKTGDRPTFRDVPRRWLALDVEGIPLPERLHPADLAGCCALAPRAFWGHAGRRLYRPGVGKSRFQARHAVAALVLAEQADLGPRVEELVSRNTRRPSVFGAVQPIYTAAPKMPAGIRVPILCRFWFKPGQATVTVAPPQAPRPKPRRVTPRSTAQSVQTAGSARAELEMAAGRVCVAEKRHPTLVSEARSLARLVEAELLTEAEIRAALSCAAKAAGKDDAAEIEACVDWGLSHPSTDPLPEMQS